MLQNGPIGTWIELRLPCSSNRAVVYLGRTYHGGGKNCSTAPATPGNHIAWAHVRCPRPLLSKRADRAVWVSESFEFSTSRASCPEASLRARHTHGLLERTDFPCLGYAVQAIELSVRAIGAARAARVAIIDEYVS